MINIFREISRRRGGSDETQRSDIGKQATAVSEYMLGRLILVCDEISMSDVDALGYLEMLYFRVMDDHSIPADSRSLLDILDKLEDDLEYSVEIFGSRASFILDFLEADVLRHATDKSTNDRERSVLGRILRLKSEYFEKDDVETAVTVRRPADIKAYLDSHVIGQEMAKRAVSTAVYGHTKRNRYPDKSFPPNVVLLIGPSGCGKTEIMRRIRDISEYPVIFTDVSSLGASQYRGRHKEDILLELYEASGRKKSLAEKGIVFMDEFDKLLLPAVSDRGVNVHDDVQAQLLTMLEGSEVELKCDNEPLLLDTTHMLFVLAGAFQGIDEFIKAEKKEKEKQPGSIGFLNPLDKEMDLDFVRDNIDHEVLIRYGMKRELAGRISDICVLERLDRQDMLRILTEPEDAMIKLYERELKLSGDAKLIFTDGALEAIADEALKSTSGARALKSILGRTLKDVMYEAPQMKGLKRVIINEDVVAGNALPLYDTVEESSGLYTEQDILG